MAEVEAAEFKHRMDSAMAVSPIDTAYVRAVGDSLAGAKDSIAAADSAK